MSPISVLWTPDWHQTLFECIKTAKKEVFLVSPWLKLAGAKLILNALRENASTPKVNLLTTFNESELIGAKSSSDLKAYCLLLGYDVEVRVVRGLHAKIYICDRHHIIVSSGNLTGPGLGLNSRCNLEIALHISDPNTAQEILEQILEIWEISEILTLELLQKNVDRIQATNTDYIKSLQETSSNEEKRSKLETHGSWWSRTSGKKSSSDRRIKFNFNIAELSNLIGVKPNFQESLDACDAIQKQFKSQKKSEIVSGSEPVKSQEETSDVSSNESSSVLSQENSLVNQSDSRDVELKNEYRSIKKKDERTNISPTPETLPAKAKKLELTKTEAIGNKSKEDDTQAGWVLEKSSTEENNPTVSTKQTSRVYYSNLPDYETLTPIDNSRLPDTLVQLIDLFMSACQTSQFPTAELVEQLAGRKKDLRTLPNDLKGYFIEIILLSSSPDRGLRWLAEAGVLGVLGLQKVEEQAKFASQTDLKDFTQIALSRSKAVKIRSLPWAILLHGIGKPDVFRQAEQRTGKGSTGGYEIQSAQLAEPILAAYNLPKDLQETIALLIRHQLYLLEQIQIPFERSPQKVFRALLKRLGNQPYLVKLQLEMTRAIFKNRVKRWLQKNQESLESTLQETKKEKVQDKLVTDSPLNGNEILQLFKDIPKGSWIKETKISLGQWAKANPNLANNKQAAEKEAKIIFEKLASKNPFLNDSLSGIIVDEAFSNRNFSDSKAVSLLSELGLIPVKQWDNWDNQEPNKKAFVGICKTFIKKSGTSTNASLIIEFLDTISKSLGSRVYYHEILKAVNTVSFCDNPVVFANSVITWISEQRELLDEAKQLYAQNPNLENTIEYIKSLRKLGFDAKVPSVLEGALEKWPEEKTLIKYSKLKPK